MSEAVVDGNLVTGHRWPAQPHGWQTFQPFWNKFEPQPHR
jgi:hypothetical protein